MNEVRSEGASYAQSERTLGVATHSWGKSSLSSSKWVVDSRVSSARMQRHNRSSNMWIQTGSPSSRPRPPPSPAIPAASTGRCHCAGRMTGLAVCLHSSCPWSTSFEWHRHRRRIVQSLAIHSKDDMFRTACVNTPTKSRQPSACFPSPFDRKAMKRNSFKKIIQSCHISLASFHAVALDELSLPSDRRQSHSAV